MKRTINADGLILGRLATRVAKLALSGDIINIINCEKAVISGNRKDIRARIDHLRDMGTPFKGPFYPSKAERIVKRAIRGMLPYKQERGRMALKRVKCYDNQPVELKTADVETFPDASMEKIKSTKTFQIKRFSK
jgi:large subunit ribosomal protein L13